VAAMHVPMGGGSDRERVLSAQATADAAAPASAEADVEKGKAPAGWP